MTPRDIFVTIACGLGVAIFFDRYRGHNAAFVVLGITVLLILVIDWFFYTKGLVIHWAGHGIGDDQYADVTTLLRGYIKDNKLNVPIDGTIFPHDPYRGERKHVKVQYSYRSRVKHTKIRHDGDRLILP